MKKGGFLRNVLDTIRSNQNERPGSGSVGGSSGSARGIEFYGGQLKSSHFSLAQVARHGFPENPTALAFDPIQKIAAIGTKSGALRVFGRPGVDLWAQHKPEYAITHMRFIINQGALITVTADESIHLWSLRGPNLKLQLSTTNQSTAAGGPNSPATAASPAGQLSTSPHQNHHNQLMSDIDNTLSDFPSAPGPSSSAISTSSPTSNQDNTAASKQLEILHTLKFQREHITCLHQTLSSKWLYIGTERGNIHVVNVETFELSGYSIAWNKAIELSRKNHPGSIIHLSECPQDTNKLLIGYESGCIVLWDLKQKTADARYYHTENLLFLAWHYEGKQFIAAHGDGSLVTWQIRSNAKPSSILYPHAKTGPNNDNDQSLQQQQAFASSAFARAMNNELYRPINKVDWKILKQNNEQFLLFSGGLPYDGLGTTTTASFGSNSDQQTARAQSANISTASSSLATKQLSANQPSSGFLKASSASPNSGLLTTSSNISSPISPSISPSQTTTTSDSGFKSSSKQSLSNQQQQQQHQLAFSQKEKKSLRSTSLTVMYGKSITVLEMDDMIIDFITISDNSPYENDASDPYAVIILLSNDLILIDLTSSGYPSFDSPYPGNLLNESPVTCVQYLADCSSDLIPYLYSTSQNIISRAPKKGFSDKEWPINGGEWGQSMQSYPELVITGHLDGTIKFWDMSGVNFDLISKIKTTKLFDRPNATNLSARCNRIVPFNLQAKQQANRFQPTSIIKPSSPLLEDPSTAAYDHQQQQQQHSPSFKLELNNLIENCFAIEKIEYCPSTKHLLVAGALSQIVQFKLYKSSQQNEVTAVSVEPTDMVNKQQQHSLLKVRSTSTIAPGPTSAVPAAAAATAKKKGASSGSGSGGFQAELICLAQLQLLNLDNGLVDNLQQTLLVLPPKVTALAFQETHNM